MKFLIAGLGSIGRRHLRNLLALGERDILLYRTRQSTLPEGDLAGIPVETNLEAALAQRPDAAIIANPTALHLDVAIPAARAGCTILLEKPVSHSLDRAEEFAQALKQGGGKVLVGYQFRFHPGLQQVAGLLAEGAIGRPLSFRAVYGEYLPAMHPWEDYRISYSTRSDLGGGVILTLCHPLDYLRWLLGEVEAVWAFAQHINDFELAVEDTAEIGLQFANHAIGSVHLDYNRRPSTHHLEITGAQGVIQWDNAAGSVRLYRTDRSEWETLPTPLNADGSRPFERNDMFLAEMQHFIRIARRESEPLCTLIDGYQALRMALAARTSAQSGQKIHLAGAANL